MAPVDPKIKTTHVKLSQWRTRGQYRAWEQLPKSQAETMCPTPRGFSQQGICCLRKVRGRQEEVSFTLPQLQTVKLFHYITSVSLLQVSSLDHEHKETPPSTAEEHKPTSSMGCSHRAVTSQVSTVSGVVPLLAQHTVSCIILVIFGIISIRPTREGRYIILPYNGMTTLFSTLKPPM